ncbi:hypothetical protein F4861DRAFT_548767 [Xylaria intraflava]|nr:hypothetical protein F4861DRAFT_548767 [Xylaria intraflava]
MQTNNILGIFGLMAVIEATAINRASNNHGGDQDNGDSSNKAGSLTLNSNAVQTGSSSDGNPDTSTGEAPSATNNANFINFCSGLELTNGVQKTGGSLMGKIPAKANMVSSILVNPQNGDDIDADTDFQIKVQMANFAPGTFTNADSTYYAAPQDLDGSGHVIGHTHVTVQDLGDSLNPTTPLDATKFAFFKGINDDGNGKGLLSANVTGGLPAGNYRLCTIVSAANHQPVLMPVAQRGAQDDCIRFTVGGGGNSGNNNQSGQDDRDSHSSQGSQSSQNGENNQNNRGGHRSESGQNGQSGEHGNENDQE